MELKKTVSFKIRPQGCALTDAKWPVNNVTFVFTNEEDVLARALDDAVIALQGAIRRKAGNDMVVFKQLIAETENTTIELKAKGTREYSDKPVASAKVRSTTMSLNEQFPGITSDDKLEYLETSEDERPGLLAKFAKTYKGKNAK
jgi:hypothetical protein